MTHNSAFFRRASRTASRRAFQAPSEPSNATAIHFHATTPRLSKDPCVFHISTTRWALQPPRVKVVQEPCLTPLIIQQVNDWKVHALKCIALRAPVLQMSPNFFMLSFNKPLKSIRNLPIPKRSQGSRLRLKGAGRMQISVLTLGS